MIERRHIGPLRTPLCRHSGGCACAGAGGPGGTSAERRRQMRRSPLQERRRRRRRRQRRMLIAPRWRRRADSSVAFVRLLRLLLLLLRVERSVARAASLIAHGGKEREGKRKRKTRDSKKKKSETVLVDLDLDLFSYSPLSLRTNWTPVRAFLFSLSLFLTTKRTKKRYLIEKSKVGTFHLSLFLCFSSFLSLSPKRKKTHHLLPLFPFSKRSPASSRACPRRRP